MKNLNSYFTLSNGYKIPVVGFGTWQSSEGEIAYNAVSEALKSGYTHIDTAAAYGNEVSVGRAVKDSGRAREEIFITSKLWNTNRGYDTTLAAAEKTCRKLGVYYLDLYLIHWPAVKKQFDNWDKVNLDTWRAITRLYKEGVFRAIGVSNFMPHHLNSLMETEIPPMVNQIEYHPGFMQKYTVDYCKKHNILVEAWSPLGTGRMLNNEVLKEIAEKYGRSVAQICIRWALQNGALPLPKSVTPGRIAENINVFDFEISDNDMAIINKLPDFGSSGFNPDDIDF